MSTKPGSNHKTRSRKQKQVVMRPYGTAARQRSQGDQVATSPEPSLNGSDLQHRDLLTHLRELGAIASRLQFHAAEFERLTLQFCGRVALPVEYVAARTGHQTVAGACVPECPACEVRS